MMANSFKKNIPETSGKIAVLSGGVGAAKFLSALKSVVPASRLAAIVNTGDDFQHCGLHISPDLDTVTYTLASLINKSTGWGLAGESWNAMENLKVLEGAKSKRKFGWFNLGDKDLGTHLYRTARLAEGATLTDVTAEIAESYGVELLILPMSDNPVETKVQVKNGDLISFQEYFVKLKHQVAIESVIYEGAETATPTPQVLTALESAEKILIAPSNPILSIGPIFALGEIGKIIRHRRRDTTFISPIIGGRALKGPADRVLAELGHIPDACGVAQFYSDFADSAIIDTQDQNLVPDIEALGLKCLAVNTIMSNPKKSARLAAETLEFIYA